MNKLKTWYRLLKFALIKKHYVIQFYYVKTKDGGAILKCEVDDNMFGAGVTGNTMRSQVLEGLHTAILKIRKLEK